MFRDEKIWRILTNFWTFVFAAFLVFNFFQKNNYGAFIAPLSVTYAGVLGLYAGTKEFDRWYEMHESRHPGEWFVLGWTVLIFVFLAFSFASGGEFKVPSEAIAVYIMVLSIFALTQKSKRLYHEKMKKRS
jgi:hypothetical protein